MSNQQIWTLKSIAKKLGVSNATVSNAFNRPDQLSAKKREEILKACEELEYFGPNKAAQSLRNGRFNIVALVLPDAVEYMITDPVASEFMRGMSSVLESNEINVLLFSGSSPNIASVADFVDGFICYGQPRNVELISQLKKTRKKVVTVDFNIKRNAEVRVNNKQAAYDVAKLAVTSKNDNVLVLGLRLNNSSDIGPADITSDSDSTSSIAHERLFGYQEAINEVGAELIPNGVWNIPESTSKAALKAAKQILALEALPKVVLCMSDLIALALLRALKKQGIKVGVDIKVAGFDGITATKHSSPTLTTVYQNSAEKGRLAARLFIDNAKHSVTVDYSLYQGKST